MLKSTRSFTSCFFGLLVVLGFFFWGTARGLCQQSPGNNPDRLEWFRDQGFGLFIHWSVDSQLGLMISHSLVGASDDYVSHFFGDLPKTFNPWKFHPADWAILAKLAGVRYVVFTAKHHSGFCMFNTATTDFNILHTPFKTDITGEILQAFREQGIAPGIYFSPDDFLWLHEHGKTIQRNIPDVQPRNNPGLMSYDQAQVQELLTHYGPVDVIFFDGEAEGLRELAWKLQPNIVVTRGALQTPEGAVPGVPLEGPWEVCLSMGTAWQYQPSNVIYKSGGELIGLLIETRAKGGNLLLNVGPKPDGELPIEQEERLREIALWMFINHESIYSVRPWVVTNENDIWFTKKKNEDTVFAFLKGNERLKYGVWKEVVLRSVQATDKTRVSVLGQNGEVIELQPKTAPKPIWKQAADGLHIRAMQTQLLSESREWPDPNVLKITSVRPALMPPRVETLSITWDANTEAVILEGRVTDMGQADFLEVGFQYQVLDSYDLRLRGSWKESEFVRLNAPGRFTLKLPGLKPGAICAFRALARHAVITAYGKERTLALK